MPKEVSEWEIIQDIQRVNEQVKGRLRCADYIEKGRHAEPTVRKKFGSWNNALENALVDKDLEDTELYETWKKELKGHHGRHHLEDIVAILETDPDKIRKIIADFVDWAKTQDDFHINANHSGGGQTSKKYFITGGFEQKLEGYLNQVPDEARDRVRKLIGQGKNPKAVIGAALYVEDDDKSQVEAAREAGTSTQSLRKYQDEFVDIFQNQEDEEDSSEDTEDKSQVFKGSKESETEVVEPSDKEKMILEYTGAVSNPRKKLMRKVAKEVNFYYEGEDKFNYTQLKQTIRRLDPDAKPEQASSEEVIRYLICQEADAITEESEFENKLTDYQIAKILNELKNRENEE